MAVALDHIADLIILRLIVQPYNNQLSKLMECSFCTDLMHEMKMTNAHHKFHFMTQSDAFFNLFWTHTKKKKTRSEKHKLYLHSTHSRNELWNRQDVVLSTPKFWNQSDSGTIINLKCIVCCWWLMVVCFTAGWGCETSLIMRTENWKTETCCWYCWCFSEGCFWCCGWGWHKVSSDCSCGVVSSARAPPSMRNCL